MHARQLFPAVVMLLALTVLTGVAYPLVVTGVAQALFEERADGSLVEAGGRVVGSRLLGQSFTRPGYFHPRPSAADYDGGASSGSNLGPSNAELIDTVAARAAAYRTENGLPAGAPVPVDAVTASASGLDPHVSVANARAQARRVAQARGMPLASVLALVETHTEERTFGFLGEERVNVLELNLALDAAGDRK